MALRSRRPLSVEVARDRPRSRAAPLRRRLEPRRPIPPSPRWRNRPATSPSPGLGRRASASPEVPLPCRILRGIRVGCARRRLDGLRRPRVRGRSQREPLGHPNDRPIQHQTRRNLVRVDLHRGDGRGSREGRVDSAQAPARWRRFPPATLCNRAMTETARRTFSATRLTSGESLLYERFASRALEFGVSDHDIQRLLQNDVDANTDLGAADGPMMIGARDGHVRRRLRRTTGQDRRGRWPREARSR